MKITIIFFVFLLFCFGFFSAHAQQNQHNAQKTPSVEAQYEGTIAINYDIMFQGIKDDNSEESIKKKLEELENSKTSPRDRLADPDKEKEKVRLLELKKQELLDKSKAKPGSNIKKTSTGK